MEKNLIEVKGNGCTVIIQNRNDGYVRENLQAQPEGQDDRNHSPYAKDAAADIHLVEERRNL